MADFSSLFAKKLGDASSGAAPTKPSSTLAAEPLPARKKKRKHKALEGSVADSATESSKSSSVPTALPAQGNGSGGKLQRQMATQLAGAQFRYINEQLYTRPSAEAVALFKEEPRLYEAYHEGFRSQATRWPQRPVQVIAEWLQGQPASRIVADLGCGDAELAASVPQIVHSFDLVAANSSVVACDIAAVPLADRSVHVVIFCLALMGSNFVDFLSEETDAWDNLLHALGFDQVRCDPSNSHFVLYEYVKSMRAPQSDLPCVQLKPCAYKKR